MSVSSTSPSESVVCMCRSPLMSLELDQLRQLAVLLRIGQRELAAALAQLRLDVGEPEPLVDAGLVLEGLDLAALDLLDPVLGDREALLHGALAQLHVVLLGAGEVLQQVPELGRRHDPQVDADPGVGADVAAARCRSRPSPRRARARAAPRPAPRDRSRWRRCRCPCRSRPSAGRSRPSRPGPRRGRRAGRRRGSRRRRAPRRAGGARPDRRPRAWRSRRARSPRASRRGP